MRLRTGGRWENSAKLRREHGGSTEVGTVIDEAAVCVGWLKNVRQNELDKASAMNQSTARQPQELRYRRSQMHTRYTSRVHVLTVKHNAQADSLHFVFALRTGVCMLSGTNALYFRARLVPLPPRTCPPYVPLGHNAC
jgi:hypothetical protein